ncbi:MAG: phage terminase large subunit [Chloroflexota bacterium]|nr:phage terminase large subunit [Chloroflexota bacterium]
MTKTNLRNTPDPERHQGQQPLHFTRKFFPTARQRQLYEALRSAPDPGLALVGYGGAMGGGKTRAIVEIAIDAALMHPGNNVLVARDDFTNLSTTTMKEFFQVCPPEMIWRRQQAPTNLVQLRLPSWPQGQTSTVNFRHLSDWTGLGSQQYGAVLIDEAGEVDEQAAQMLLTRLRHPAQTQRWFVAASNPWPGWFERWFVDRELDEQSLALAQGRVVFVPARIADNPHLPPNYAEQQRALHQGDWVERFIEGRFDAFAGQVYQHFDPRLHLWNAPLPPFSRYIGGIDFGGPSEQAHYTAGIVAGITSREASCGPNVLIRLDEFEERGEGVVQRLEQWQRRCRRVFGRIRWCADRSQSAWIEHQKRQRIRVVPSKGGDGSVAWGISLVQDRLGADPPRSFYTANLKRFPRRMREYRWEQRASGNPRPRKHNDDLLDADRYMHELAEKRKRTGPRRINFDLQPLHPRYVQLNDPRPRW